MLRKGKVITLSMGGRRNNIYKAGDVVTANDIEGGDFDEKVKGGWIKEFTEEEYAKDNETTKALEAKVALEAKEKKAIADKLEADKLEAELKIREALKQELRAEIEAENLTKVDIPKEDESKDEPTEEDQSDDIKNLTGNNSEVELREMLSKLRSDIPSSWNKTELAAEIVKLTE